MPCFLMIMPMGMSGFADLGGMRVAMMQIAMLMQMLMRHDQMNVLVFVSVFENRSNRNHKQHHRQQLNRGQAFTEKGDRKQDAEKWRAGIYCLTSRGAELLSGSYIKRDTYAITDSADNQGHRNINHRSCKWLQGDPNE